jgi:hypothetical protein
MGPLVMQKKKIGTEKQRDSSINGTRRTYPVTAKHMLKDLTNLLDALGISVKFKITKTKARHRTVAFEDGVQPYVFEIGEVLSFWHREPAYLDKAGNPRPLPPTGKILSFRSLVSIAGVGLSAKKILAELQKIDAVSVDADGNVHALRRSVPAFLDRDFAINHSFLALRGFIRTLQHNLDSRPSNVDQLFHRIAWNGAFNRGETSRLKNWITEHGESFLESIDDWMKKHSAPRSRRRSKGNATVNAAIGIYMAVDS